MDLVYEVPRIPQVGESIDASSLQLLPGGKGANKAIAAHRASHLRPRSQAGLAISSTSKTTEQHNSNDFHIFLNGAVGNDAFAQPLLTSIAATGVSTDLVQHIPGQPSGTCSVFVCATTAQSCNAGCLGANKQWSFNNNHIEALCAGRTPDLLLCQLGTPDLDVLTQVLLAARKEHVDVVLDASPYRDIPRNLFPCVSHLLLNEAEGALVAGVRPGALSRVEVREEVGDRFVKLGVRNVVITLGGAGAWYLSVSGGGVDGRRDTGTVPAVRVADVVDTTGAGYAFPLSLSCCFFSSFSLSLSFVCVTVTRHD